MSSILTLDNLKALAAANPPREVQAVPVYEFGPGMVAYVGELTADERDSRLEVPWNQVKERLKKEDNSGLRAFLVAACLCHNQHGEFQAKDAKAIEELAAELGKQKSAPVTRLFEKAQELNGMGDAQVEELEKN